METLLGRDWLSSFEGPRADFLRLAVRITPTFPNVPVGRWLQLCLDLRELMLGSGVPLRRWGECGNPRMKKNEGRACIIWQGIASCHESWPKHHIAAIAE